MFASSSVLTFFPSYVWVYEMAPEDYQPLNAAIMRKIEQSLTADRPLLAGHSLQSETNLQELAELRPLFDWAQTAAQQILEFLDYSPSPLRITGCWANVSGPAAYHKEHSHPNNFLSCAYYVAAPKGGNTINFHDPRSMAHVMAPHGAAPTAKNASTIFVEVNPGTMVFFPSWLRHSVDPNRSGCLRVSLAFNLMFDRFAEQQSYPRFTGALEIMNRPELPSMSRLPPAKRLPD